MDIDSLINKEINTKSKSDLIILKNISEKIDSTQKEYDRLCKINSAIVSIKNIDDNYHYWDSPSDKITLSNNFWNYHYWDSPSDKIKILELSTYKLFIYNINYKLNKY